MNADAARASTPAPPWWSSAAAERLAAVRERLDGLEPAAVGGRVHDLLAASRATHLERCVNLNPATNVLHPSVAAMLGDDAGMRPSLGHPGEKYETGLAALEELEVLATDLARRLLHARHVDLRVPSGSVANLVAFRAACAPGDAVVVLPPALGGHVTHHAPGAPGILGLDVHHAPVDAAGHTVDLDRLAAMVRRVRPRLVSVGGSLNLLPHPVARIRAIADSVGAVVLYDAAHAIGMHVGDRWASPLGEGAHLLTSSTYKSLGGPPGGLVATNHDRLAERVDRLVHPGLSANFDLGRTAALAVTLGWWLTDAGPVYARAMQATAARLADALLEAEVPVHLVAAPDGTPTATTSHQLALDARDHGGGTALAHRLEAANLLASAIGLPVTGDPADADAGLRLGTPELVRWGVGPQHADELASLLARAISADDPTSVAQDVTAFRARFPDLHHAPTTSPG